MPKIIKYLVVFLTIFFLIMGVSGIGQYFAFSESSKHSYCVPLDACNKHREYMEQLGIGGVIFLIAAIILPSYYYLNFVPIETRKKYGEKSQAYIPFIAILIGFVIISRIPSVVGAAIGASFIVGGGRLAFLNYQDKKKES